MDRGNNYGVGTTLDDYIKITINTKDIEIVKLTPDKELVGPLEQCLNVG